MKNRLIKFAAAGLVLFLSIAIPAQTGGNYTITQRSSPAADNKARAARFRSTGQSVNQSPADDSPIRRLICSADFGLQRCFSSREQSAAKLPTPTP